MENPEEKNLEDTEPEATEAKMVRLSINVAPVVGEYIRARSEATGESMADVVRPMIFEGIDRLEGVDRSTDEPETDRDVKTAEEGDDGLTDREFMFKYGHVRGHENAYMYEDRPISMPLDWMKEVLNPWIQERGWTLGGDFRGKGPAAPFILTGVTDFEGQDVPPEIMGEVLQKLKKEGKAGGSESVLGFAIKPTEPAAQTDSQRRTHVEAVHEAVRQLDDLDEKGWRQAFVERSGEPPPLVPPPRPSTDKDLLFYCDEGFTVTSGRAGEVFFLFFRDAERSLMVSLSPKITSQIAEAVGSLLPERTLVDLFAELRELITDPGRLASESAGALVPVMIDALKSVNDPELRGMLFAMVEKVREVAEVAEADEDPEPLHARIHDVPAREDDPDQRPFRPSAAHLYCPRCGMPSSFSRSSGDRRKIIFRCFNLGCPVYTFSEDGVEQSHPLEAPSDLCPGCHTAGNANLGSGAPSGSLYCPNLHCGIWAFTTEGVMLTTKTVKEAAPEAERVPCPECGKILVQMTGTGTFAASVLYVCLFTKCSVGTIWKHKKGVATWKEL